MRLTVDQAMAQLMVAEGIADAVDRRAEYRRILDAVHSSSWNEGYEARAEEEAYS